MRSVLEILPKAQKITTHLISLQIPYKLFEQTKLLTQSHQGLIQSEDFGIEVRLNIQLTYENLESFQQGIQELSNGKILAKVIETNPNTIMPLNPH
jgi:hypothetical protein